MKKLSILLLAAVMLFTCFALAACGDDGDTSSTSGTSSSTSTSSTSGTSSAAGTSNTSSATSTSSEASEESSAATSSEETSDPAAESSDSSTGGEAQVGDASPFWVTHYDDYTPEGAGMILTEDVDISSWKGEWCDHYAFKPIEGVENGYELVELSYGTIVNGDQSANGQGHTLTIPAGGFVYASSIGNNYTSEGIDPSKPDYVNENCNQQLSRCRTWKVGDKFIITGLDLSGKTVPKSSAEDIMWYESGYVCTATIAPLS